MTERERQALIEAKVSIARIAQLARGTGSLLLMSFLGQAERCAAGGCVVCATDAVEYRAALNLQEFDQTRPASLEEKKE